MFVPRALRLKGVNETRKPRPAKPQAPPAGGDAPCEDALVHAEQQTSTTSAATSPASQPGHENKQARGPKPANAPVSAEYLAQLAAGVELIFTDYAHQDRERANWLKKRYRSIDAGEKYVHLTAVLEHPNIGTLKPLATQPLVRQALQEISSETLELSEDGFYVRRRPSTYPSSFVPSNSFQVINEGLSFWDQRTIYVEPHIRHMCKTPAKVAHWLKEHGQLKAKWLPVQAVHTLYNSCAFVVLSGVILHEDQWKKWRATERPVDWKIMTKVEHAKRTAEYLALLEASKGNPNRRPSKAVVMEDSPATARTIPDQQPIEDGGQGAQKKKRKRSKKSMETVGVDDTAMPGEGDDAGDAAPEADGSRTSKRRN